MTGTRFLKYVWMLRDIIQSAIFTAGQLYLFPLATLIDIYNSYLHLKNYKEEPNKHWGRKGTLAIHLVSTGAQVVAVAACIAAFYGMPFLGLGMISTIFLGSIALKAIPHFIKTIYHGIQWARSSVDTKKNEKHRIEFRTHLKKTLLIVATCAGMAMMPIFPVVAMAVVTAIAVKTMAVAVIGLLGIHSIHRIYKNRQLKKQQAREWQENYLHARAKREEFRQIHQKLEHTILHTPREKPKIEVVDDLIKEFGGSTFENPEGPPDDDKPRAYFGPNAALRIMYQNRKPNLKKDDVDDLICALEATDEIEGPKLTLLALLRQAIESILKNLAVEYDLDPNTHQLELNDNLCLPEMRDKSFNLSTLFQKADLRNKLHTVLMLEALIRKNKEAILVIKEQGKCRSIYTPYDLKQYIKYKNRTQSVFQSFFSDAKMKELFEVVDYYMRNKDLHPETRQTYAQTWRYRPKPTPYTCLAAPC